MGAAAFLRASTGTSCWITVGTSVIWLAEWGASKGILSLRLQSSLIWGIYRVSTDIDVRIYNIYIYVIHIHIVQVPIIHIYI